MTHRELLASHKVVRQLSAVQFIAYFGAWFSNVAIYTMLVDFGASAVVIATVTAMHLIPGIILAPFSGSIVDRLPVKPLMIALLSTELVMTLSFLSIDSLNDIWLLLILLFIRMGSASMFFTSEMTLLPKILGGGGFGESERASLHHLVFYLHRRDGPWGNSGEPVRGEGLFYY